MLHAGVLLSNVICPNPNDVAIVQGFLAYLYALLSEPFRKWHRAAVEARLQRYAVDAYRARLMNPAAHAPAPSAPALTPIGPILASNVVAVAWQDEASNAAPGFDSPAFEWIAAEQAAGMEDGVPVQIPASKPRRKSKKAPPLETVTIAALSPVRQLPIMPWQVGFRAAVDDDVGTVTGIRGRDVLIDFGDGIHRVFHWTMLRRA
jgi:hypothetical protein